MPKRKIAERAVNSQKNTSKAKSPTKLTEEVENDLKGMMTRIALQHSVSFGFQPTDSPFPQPRALYHRPQLQTSHPSLHQHPLVQSQLGARSP